MAALKTAVGAGAQVGLAQRFSLARDVTVLAASTAISRLLGLLRDIVIADKFGASAAFDAYIIAFTVPHLLRRLLAEGALSSALVPIHAEIYMREGPMAARRFTARLLTVALLFFPALTLLGALAAPVYVPWLASGFPADKLQLTIVLTRITFPFIALMGTAAIMMGVLNSHRHFYAPAFAPVWFNLGMIAAVLALTEVWREPVYALAAGTLLGGLGQLVFQLPFLKGKLDYRLDFVPRDAALRKLLAMMVPSVVALAIFQINVVVDNMLASQLGDGSISVLQYAIRLFQLPMGVFVVSVGTAILPRLSAHAAAQDGRAMAATLRQGMRFSAFITLPAAVGLFVMGEPIIKLLFEHGEFDARATHQTAYVLSMLLPGLIGYALAYVLTRFFYAMQDTRRPLIAGAASVVLNVVLDFILVGPLGVGGLALATSIAGLVNMVVLYALLPAAVRRAQREASIWDLCKLAMCAGVMGLVTYEVYLWLSARVTSELVRVALPVAVGLLCYLGLARLAKLRV